MSKEYNLSMTLSRALDFVQIRNFCSGKTTNERYSFAQGSNQNNKVKILYL